ncbi:acyltransferase family protein [Zafaria sp. Z1313]|uniref:acyltransferase family protein n=1 Tax=unclassified Zafaria TaxID=2828765 RepID=UPI002E790998|nr:acyltransferase [Zafaria sp. J156]MEE1620577.1 acyltransferase [Zafaria sp. J156]
MGRTTTIEAPRAGASPGSGTSPAAGAARSAGSPGGDAGAARGPRLALLDGLRLVAALLVVLYHYTAWHHGHWGVEPAKDAWPVLSRFTLFGNMGVQLFFVISGFVILLSSYGKSPARFIGSRIGRLFPAYWAAVLLTGVLVFFIWPSMGERLSYVDWAVNLTMLQGGTGNPHVDGVYWTLWAELRFYALVLLVMLLGWQTPRRLLAFAAAWPVAALAAPLLPGNFLSHALMPEYAPLFAGGMVLFLMYRFGQTPLRWAVLGLNVVLSAHHAGVTGAREAEELVGYSVPEPVYWAIVAGIFAVVALLSLTRLRSVSLPGMALAGALTYPVYLLHQVWGWWIIDQLSPWMPRWAVLPLVIAIVGAAAYLVHRHIERRFGRRLGQAATRLVEAVEARRAPARAFARRVMEAPAVRVLPNSVGGIVRGR